MTQGWSQTVITVLALNPKPVITRPFPPAYDEVVPALVATRATVTSSLELLVGAANPTVSISTKAVYVPAVTPVNLDVILVAVVVYVTPSYLKVDVCKEAVSESQTLEFALVPKAVPSTSKSKLPAVGVTVARNLLVVF